MKRLHIHCTCRLVLFTASPFAIARLSFSHAQTRIPGQNRHSENHVNKKKRNGTVNTIFVINLEINFTSTVHAPCT